MQKTSGNWFGYAYNTTSSGARFLPLLAFVLLVLGFGPATFRAAAQAPNVTYQGPITISKGGTYTGNYRSTDSNTPAIKIATSEPVILDGCIIASAGDHISAVNGGAVLTVRNCKSYGLTPSQDNIRRGRFLATHAAKSVRVENNYLEQTTGITIHQWTGDGSPSQTLTILRNQVRNIDSRYRNGGGTKANFVGMDKVTNIGNIEIAWNEVVNTPNNSLVEDNINFYSSGGVSGAWAKVHDNYIQGAYPYPATGTSFYGTGMITDGLKDGALPAFIESFNNQFVSICNGGMNLAAGHDIYYHHNRIVTAALMPDGTTKLPAAYSGVAIFNYNNLSSSVFYNHRVDNNTIGYVKWGYNRPYANRNDEADYGLQIATNTQHMPNPITLDTEKNEWTIWQNKLSSNNVKIGVGGSGGGTTTTPPTTTTNKVPTVSLTSSSTSPAVNTAVKLTASASDADGTVSKVEFFSGSTKLGEDTSSPYELSWTPTASGSVSLTAKATDNAGGTATSAAVSVSVQAATSTTPPPTTTPVAGTFYRAIDLNGAASTIDGKNWEGNAAPNYSMNGTLHNSTTVALIPSTDATRTAMIRSSKYTNAVDFKMSSIANGSYQVYLYVWEDNNSETFSVQVEGQSVQTGIVSGSAGTWKKLGPYAANITDGVLNVTTTGGTVNLSGVEVWAGSTTTTTTANKAPSVSLTASNTAPTVNTAIKLTASASDADGTVSKVEFFSGSTKLGEDTSSPYELSWTPTATGTFSLTAKATDNSAAATTSGAVSVSVKAATTTTTPTTTTAFYRAIDLNGAASTIDGKSWEGNAAPNYSMNGTLHNKTTVALIPSTDAARTAMIRSSKYTNTVDFKMTSMTNGSYQVYLYVWEDNYSETFSVQVEGQSVQTGIVSGSAGTWKKLGPYAANITDGVLNVTTTGGTVNLSGVEVYKQTTTASIFTPAAGSLNVASAPASVYPTPMAGGLVQLPAFTATAVVVPALNARQWALAPKIA
ncbi:Ig-like domain-containing protein [Hymenobacter sp. DG25A]|uniref:Ig-like domain-containing protein n=1 Tax=Hymenobacter sp. DG25A TaxID=1385663 RepID=UPI000A5C33CF|nr:Ig-like domain-containing protein [Hymenobacter sp. DG25A]